VGLSDLLIEGIKVVGFDLDGTLYPYTEEIQRRNREEIYGELSRILGIHFEDVDKTFNGLYNDRSEECCGSGSRTIERIGRIYGKELNGVGIVQECLTRANVWDLIEENFGLVKMLNDLSKKYCLDLVTSTHSSLMHPKLERIGINIGVFNYVFTGENGSKSNGSIFKEWLKLRDFNVNEYLYVGDNERVDIDVPKSLGIKTCFIGDYEEADYCVDNIVMLRFIL